MAVVNEIITEFGYQGSISPLTEYNKALGQSIGLLTATAAGIIATAGAIATFVTSTTKSIDPMIQLSRVTGEAVEDLQELSFVASVSGSSAEALQGSIASLTDKIGEAAQKGSEDFARLGISVRDVNGNVKSASDILEEVGQRFKDLDLSLSEQRNFASSLGIDPSLIQLLNRSSKEMSELRKQARELGIVTTEQANAAASLNDSMTTLLFGLGGVRNQIAVGLAPEMERITGEFIGFLQANRDVIADGVSGVVKVLTSLAETTIRVLPIISSIAAAFGVWKVASIGLGTVLGTILSPVVLITAGITAFILVIDDLIVAAQGGQSVIADFFSEFFGIDIAPALNATYDAFVSFIDFIADSAKGGLSVLSDLFSFAFSIIRGDFDGAADAALSLFSTFSGAAHKAVDFVVGAFSGLSDLNLLEFGKDIALGLVSPLRDAFDSVFEFFTSRLEYIKNIASGLGSFFGFGGDSETDQGPQEPIRISQEETRLVTVREVTNKEEQEGLSDEQLNRVIRLQDVMLDSQIPQPDVKDLELQRRIFVREISELENADIPQPEINDQDLTRVVRIEDVNELTRDNVPSSNIVDLDLQRRLRIRELSEITQGDIPDTNVMPQDAKRVLRVQDVVLSTDSIEIDQPDIDPVTTLRSIGIVNDFTQSGDAPLPFLDSQTFTRNVDVNDKFNQVNDDLAGALVSGKLDIDRVAPSLQPQALSTINNNESRNITIENNNQFSISGDRAVSVADSVADRLQDQLEDAAAQIRVGGF